MNLVHVLKDHVKMAEHVLKLVTRMNASVLLVSVVRIVRSLHAHLNPVKTLVSAKSLVVLTNAPVKLDILVMTVK